MGCRTVDGASQSSDIHLQPPLEGLSASGPSHASQLRRRARAVHSLPRYASGLQKGSVDYGYCRTKFSMLPSDAAGDEA